MLRRYTLSQASEKLGLDEAELRFLLLHFREFLQSASMTDPLQALTNDDLAILQRVYRMVREEGRDPVEIRAALRSELTGVRKSGGCQGGVLAFTSGRTGTGKSVLLWNLAIALANRGHQCTVYDGATGPGGIGDLLRSSAAATSEIPGWEQTFDSGVALVSGEKLLGALKQASHAEARDIDQRLRGLDALSDFVLLDTGQGRSDNALRYAMVSDEIIEVTTTDVGANADSFAVIRMLHDVDPDIRISMIVNRAINLGEAREAFARINGSAHKVGIAELASIGWVAEDETIRQCMARGETVVEAMPTSPAARCVGRLADHLANRLTPVQRRGTGPMMALAEALKLSLERHNPALDSEKKL